ncbi:tyrosine-type recombinase/integrase [Halogeometricum pallidum]|uniref:tyrosine-type recombinase/integrase n=1 Tax=Halogeometricum pallidum TaxID=411361 RepID=UPI000A019994|nr:tyrosine-type recombinase/integrase [Halogeometricum pallidum]
MPTMDFDLQVARILKNIDESSEIHPANKRLIREFHRDLLLDGINAARRQKLTSHLKIIAQYLGEKRFDALTREDITELVEWIHSRGSAPSTVSDYKQVVKQFYKWYNGGEEPETTKWIRRGPPTFRQILPRNLLSPDDVSRLIDACVNDRDRAFIALLWETGARIGELIDLCVGDIEDDGSGKHVIVIGKTGARRLPLVESRLYLEQWLQTHPSLSAQAPLWCKLEQGTPDEQISYNYIRLRLLERARKRAGIDKPVNPHHFRHSRATHLANWLTEAQLCEWFGWVLGSKVPARYVHLSGRDIDNAYFALFANRRFNHLPITN